MAHLEEHDLLTDPSAMLAERNSIALRNMQALITLVESAKDERVRVTAATELNRMLSLGILNRGGIVKAATQVNNLHLSTPADDPATRRLLDRFGGTATVDDDDAVAETLHALISHEDT